MRRKRKIKYFRISIFALIAALMLSGAFKIVNNFLPRAMDKLSSNFLVHISGLNYDAASPSNMMQQISMNSSNSKLHSPYAILVRLKDQKVMFKAKSEERIYPASLTKIMTAIVAIENISDLETTISTPKHIFTDLYKANASMAGFLPGEKVSAIDLLYGTMLPSGADAALGLAIGVSGSESEFVKLMNDKCKELDMDDTHFTNVSGLYDENHYTTVKDMSVLLKHAMKNKTFRKVFTTERHATAKTNLHPDGITFYSTMFKNMDTNKFDGGRILGGKTGYTAESGLCLASLAEKNGSEYILITAGAAGDHNTEQYHIIDALTVYGKYLKK